MNNQNIDGKTPPQAPATPPGAPATLEQQLAKEREERVLMRDRLRHTEALAAESHALRARMAEELERVTADRDRLRHQATAAAPGPATASAPSSRPSPMPPAAPRPPAAAGPAASRPVEPPLTSAGAASSASALPHGADRPFKPPPTGGGKGPWGALGMLSLVALLVAAGAWYKAWRPGATESPLATVPAAAAPASLPDNVGASSTRLAAATPSMRTATAPVAGVSPSTGAVALPPLAPEAQLAAAPTAAGATATAVPAPAGGMPERLRKALSGEGIAASVEVDPATGHVVVSDPQADNALRQRTELVIRAVYAGASLPEPQIEHRWLAPLRGEHEATASAQPPAAAAAVVPPPPLAGAPVSTRPTATATALGRESRHEASLHAAERHRTAATMSVADAEDLTPVLPAGRVTASCMEGLTGRSSARRPALTACMKHSCCSNAASHNSEECRAYERAYPFTCGAG